MIWKAFSLDFILKLGYKYVEIIIIIISSWPDDEPMALHVKKSCILTLDSGDFCLICVRLSSQQGQYACVCVCVFTLLAGRLLSPLACLIKTYRCRTFPVFIQGHTEYAEGQTTDIKTSKVWRELQIKGIKMKTCQISWLEGESKLVMK